MDCEPLKLVVDCDHLILGVDDEGMPSVVLQYGFVGMRWNGDAGDLASVAAVFDTMLSDYLKRHPQEVKS